jgi:hypothetical protein
MNATMSAETAIDISQRPARMECSVCFDLSRQVSMNQEQLVGEEQTRQAVRAVLVGVAAGANSYSAARAGMARVMGRLTPQGAGFRKVPRRSGSVIFPPRGAIGG